VRTVAMTRQGVDELVNALEAHRVHLQTLGAQPKNVQARAKLLGLVRDEVERTLCGPLLEALEAAAIRVASGESSPYEESASLLRRFRSE
jgi:LAO/AO transport system kinase